MDVSNEPFDGVQIRIRENFKLVEIDRLLMLVVGGSNHLAFCYVDF